MQGWAPDFISKLTDDAVAAGLIDEIVPVAGADALRLSRELASRKASSSASRAAPRWPPRSRWRRRAPAGSNIVCMLPDTGERYLSTPLFDGIGEEMTAEELGDLALHAAVPLRCTRAGARAGAAAGDRVAALDAGRRGAIRRAAGRRRERAGGDVRARVVRVLLVGAQAVRAAAASRYRSVDVDSVEYPERRPRRPHPRGAGGSHRRATMPQIFMGGEHIGGCTDLFDAWRNGSLQKTARRGGRALRPQRHAGSVFAAAQVAAAAQERMRSGR